MKSIRILFVLIFVVVIANAQVLRKDVPSTFKTVTIVNEGLKELEEDNLNNYVKYCKIVDEVSFDAEASKKHETVFLEGKIVTHEYVDGKVDTKVNPKNDYGVNLAPQKFAVSVFSKEELQALFNEMMAEGDISYMYPEDGCFTRAHQFALKLLKRGYFAGKVFVTGILQAKTDMTKEGYIDWGAYHVAPFVMVRGEDGKLERYVLDPALFRKGPVPYTDWNAAITPDNIIDSPEEDDGTVINPHGLVATEEQTPMHYFVMGDYQHRSRDWNFTLADYIGEGGDVPEEYQRDEEIVDPTYFKNKKDIKKYQAEKFKDPYFSKQKREYEDRLKKFKESTE
ncbi:protein-glutamine glutaminase family protein [Bacteriovoracaceae bacterium]|nr:protein-glutamine glutaminase family protein [Bacteriovoracaceae bacterium]